MTGHPILGWQDYYVIDGYAAQGVGSINEEREIITSEQINGYGGAPSDQKPFEINYQKGILKYSGDFSGNIFLGDNETSKAFRSVLSHTIDMSLRRENINFAQYADRSTLPDDGGKCLVAGLTINFVAGQAVSYSVHFVSNTKKSGNIHELPSYGVWHFEPIVPYPSTVVNDDRSQLAWYDVNFSIEGIPTNVISSSNIIAFTLSIDNGTYVEYTFTGEQTAFRVSQGIMRVSGKLTYVPNIGSDEGLGSYDPFKLTVKLADEITLVMPHCYVLPEPLSNPGLNGLITRTENLHMFCGDNYEASIYEA